MIRDVGLRNGRGVEGEGEAREGRHRRQVRVSLSSLFVPIIWRLFSSGFALTFQTPTLQVRPRPGRGRRDRRVGGPRVRGLPQEGQIRIHTVSINCEGRGGRTEI